MRLQVLLLVVQAIGIASIAAGIALVCVPAAFCFGGVAAVVVVERLAT